MRLLVVSQYFWPEDFRINELVSELTTRGHAVTVLTGKPNYPGGKVFPDFTATPDSYASYHGARVVRAPMISRGRGRLRLLLNYVTFALGASIVAAVQLRGEDFDAIFVFEPSPVTVGLPAVFLRASRGWPIAFWVLDQWPESLAAVGAVRSDGILRVVGGFVRFIYSRCDLLLSPSRLLIPRIRTYCRMGQRIEYFPNWVESAYAVTRQDSAPEVPDAGGSFTVMFAGNIGEAQDFPAILAAAERLKARDDIRWILVGDGRMEPWVKAEIARRGLDDRVLLLGRFPADRMPSFFRHADALLVSLKANPVFAMTAPGKIQSYLAFGRPVLAMLDGEGASVIADAGAGYSSPAGNAELLATNVARLVALSQSERDGMGRNGSDYARREFDRGALVDNLEVWLADIASASRPEAAL